MKEQARRWWRQASQMAEEAKTQDGRFDELVQCLSDHARKFLSPRPGPCNKPALAPFRRY